MIVSFSSKLYNYISVLATGSKILDEEIATMQIYYIANNSTVSIAWAQYHDVNICILIPFAVPQTTSYQSTIQASSLFWTKEDCFDWWRMLCCFWTNSRDLPQLQHHAGKLRTSCTEYIYYVNLQRVLICIRSNTMHCIACQDITLCAWWSESKWTVLFPGPSLKLTSFNI